MQYFWTKEGQRQRDKERHMQSFWTKEGQTQREAEKKSQRDKETGVDRK